MLALLGRLPYVVRLYTPAEPCSSTSVPAEAGERRVFRHTGSLQFSHLAPDTLSNPTPAGVGGRLPLAVGGSPAAAGGTRAW